MASLASYANEILRNIENWKVVPSLMWYTWVLWHNWHTRIAKLDIFKDLTNYNIMKNTHMLQGSNVIQLSYRVQITVGQRGKVLKYFISNVIQLSCRVQISIVSYSKSQTLTWTRLVWKRSQTKCIQACLITRSKIYYLRLEDTYNKNVWCSKVIIGRMYHVHLKT